MHHPRRLNVTTPVVGLKQQAKKERKKETKQNKKTENKNKTKQNKKKKKKKSTVTYAKISPKVVNPRDVSGNAEEEEEEEEELACTPFILI